VNIGKGKGKKGKGKTANKLTVSAIDDYGVESLTVDKVEIFNKSGKLVKGKGVYEIVGNDIYVYSKGKGKSVCVTATAVDVNGNVNSEERACKPLLKCKKDKTHAHFIVEKAKIDFKKKPDDDKIHVMGKFILGENSDGVYTTEEVIVTIGAFTETIEMQAKGKGDKWEYKRPKSGTGIKHMTIHWKHNEGEFDIHVDKADIGDISSWTNPITISIQVGDDIGSESIVMKKHKHHLDYHK